jgi:fructoselysine 6-kinase
MIRIAAMGDNVVDCYPERGEMFPGGNCLNVSVFARRLGAETAYIGTIGRDRSGDLIREALLAEGVDVTRLRSLEGPTGYCVIAHRNGDRVFETFDLGVSIFTPSEDDFGFLAGYTAVHVGQSSGLDPYIARIAAAAPLSYDFSIRRDRSHRQRIAPMCYLASLSGGDLDQREAAAIGTELIEAGARWALVTRGREAAILTSRDGWFAVEPVLVEPVDTLGAGDSFIAGTLYGLLMGDAPERILAEAANNAAATCLHFGAFGRGAPIAVPALERLHPPGSG